MHNKSAEHSINAVLLIFHFCQKELQEGKRDGNENGGKRDRVTYRKLCR